MISNRTIIIYSVPLDVHFQYTKFTPAKGYDPPDGGEVSIIAIYLDKWLVTQLISESVYEEIRQELSRCIGDIQYMDNRDED